MNVLIVAPDPAQLRELGALFTARFTASLTAAFGGDGLVLETAASALFALTRLERDTPDLIVVTGDSGMSGAEFLEVVRDDPALRGVAVVLLDETALEQLTPGAYEIILEARTPPAVVLGAAASLLARRAEAELAPPPSYLQGSAELVSPFDLLSLLGHEKNTGRLSFDLNSEAVLRYAEGKLVYARYGAFVGEAALLETFRAVYAGKNIRFNYRPALTAYPDELAEFGGSGAAAGLDKPLEVLLFKLALELGREPS